MISPAERRRRRIGTAVALTLTAVVAVGATIGATTHRLRAATPAPAVAAPLTPVAAPGTMRETAQRDVEIRVWNQALAADSHSAIALGMLAALHLQRGRETANPEDYATAAALARRSLAERTNRNGAAYATLTSALLAQHDFVGARAAAAALVKLDPDEPRYRSLLAEVCTELGDYDEAAKLYASLDVMTAPLSVLPRLARWAELRGRTDEARMLFTRAMLQAQNQGSMPAEQLAWFHYRLGDLELRHGRLDAAERAFRDGLRVEPNDYRVLNGMARLSLARGRAREAIEYGDRAIAITLDPATLGVQAEAWTALGDTARAHDAMRVMEVAVSRQPGALHRAWSLLLLDHGRREADVLQRAKADLRSRHDVYGHDLVAWALFANGHVAGARREAKQALALGTEDATLFYHAGVIARAAGDTASARMLFTRALATNATFHSAQAPHARALLDSLGAVR